MTQSDVRQTTAAEEGSLALGGVPVSTAQSRACARTSVTPASPTALQAITQRVQVAGRFLASGAALLDKPGSLVHAQPMTFAQARDRHHECAGHYEALLLRWPRLFWGYFHLLIIKPTLNLLEWVTESPARFIVTAAIVAIIWIFA